MAKERQYAIVLCKDCKGVRLVSVGNAIREAKVRLIWAEADGHEIVTGFGSESPWLDKADCECSLTQTTRVVLPPTEFKNVSGTVSTTHLGEAPCRHQTWTVSKDGDQTTRRCVGCGLIIGDGLFVSSSNWTATVVTTAHGAPHWHCDHGACSTGDVCSACQMEEAYRELTRPQVACEHKKAMADGPNILCADCTEPFIAIVTRLRTSHDRLVEALEHSLEVMCEPWVLGEVRCEADCGCPIHEARAALAAARGEGE